MDEDDEQMDVEEDQDDEDFAEECAPPLLWSLTSRASYIAQLRG
jgi:hypothetical protein